jgi:cysteine desulfurase family protein (TIGR01976 family)
VDFYSEDFMPAFPIDAIRSQFPAIARHANPPVFLDNPAGTLVPRSVVEAVSEAMIEASSNLGGMFSGSKRAMTIWHDAHQAAAEIVGAKSPGEMIIGMNMTSLTMHISRSIGRLTSPGDEIILTKMDHEGDVAAWLLMAEDRGLVVKWLPFNRETWRIEPEDLAPLLSKRTRLLAINYASNMTGSINDIATLTAMAQAAGALVYVDAVQFVPHHLPDVQALKCDFLACSSYKFFGPHLGVLYGREDLLLKMEAYKCRCTPNTLPEKFELGTPQTELLAGLTATADYLKWLGEATGHSGSRREKMLGGFDSVAGYEHVLTRRLIEGIQALDGTTVHGITNPNRFSDRVPTVSFTHKSISTHSFAEALAAEEIFMWSGHNYALEPSRHLGFSDDEGVVRIGIAHYNTAAEIERTLAALENVIKIQAHHNRERS